MTWFELTSRESIDWTDAELQVRHALRNEEHTAPPALEGRVFGALDAAQPNTASWGMGVAAVALLGMLALGWSLSGTEESSPEPAIQAPVDAVMPVEVESPSIEEVSIEAATPVDAAPSQSEIVPSGKQEEVRANAQKLEALQELPAGDIDQARANPELKQHSDTQGAQTTRLPASIEVKE